MLKSIMKKMIREDYWLFLSWNRERFGTVSAVIAYIKLLANGGVGSAPNTLTGGSVYLRPGTTDQNVYDQVFLGNEYAAEFSEPHFIVDAGAHIGLASVYFASKYPAATIVALEPESSNFSVLLKNARAYPNIKPINAGLWSKKASLGIEDSKVETWSFRVYENESGKGIPAVGVRDVMDEFGVDKIDVLKIDIEGSELEVLNHSQPWMDDVQTLIIELHDKFRPGCSDALAKALSEYEYDRSSLGENVIVRNLRKMVA